MQSGIELEPHTRNVGAATRSHCATRCARTCLPDDPDPYMLRISLPPTQTCVRVRLAFLLCETQRLRPRGPTDVARDPQNNPTRAPWAGSGIDYLARTHVRASPYLTVREKLHWGPPLVPKREGQVLVVEQGGSRTGRLRFSA